MSVRVDVLTPPAAPVDTSGVRLFRWLSRYAFSRWQGLLAVVATMVAKIVLDLLKPWPMKVLVDHGLDAHPLTPGLATIVAVLPGAATQQGLIAWSIGATVLLF